LHSAVCVSIFPPVTVVIQNENQNPATCEVLPVTGFLNTKNIHAAEIHKHVVQCVESVKCGEMV
jgi:hypothetical protein